MRTEKTVVDAGKDLEKIISEIPNAKSSSPFTPEIDKLIMKYWELKNKEKFSKAVGIGIKRVKERYAFLKSNKKITI